LTDPSGIKMGKSEGNMITLADSPDDMFGKVMSWTDGMIIPGFELCTMVESVKLKLFEERLKQGENPRDLKVELAKEIVEFYFDEDRADKAEENFVQMFQKKERPDEIEEKTVSNFNIVDVLIETGLVISKSEAKRMVEQKAVKINDEIINSVEFEVKSGDVVQKGKRHFVKIK